MSWALLAKYSDALHEPGPVVQSRWHGSVAKRTVQSCASPRLGWEGLLDSDPGVASSDGLA